MPFPKCCWFSARSGKHPLPNLMATAMLAGMRSLEAIVQFARDHLPHLLTDTKRPNFAAALRRFAIRPLEAPAS